MDGKTALLALLDESASYRETGFSIDLKKAPDRWHRCVSALGLRESCAVMADALCGEYQSRYGSSCSPPPAWPGRSGTIWPPICGPWAIPDTGGTLPLICSAGKS